MIWGLWAALGAVLEAKGPTLSSVLKKLVRRSPRVRRVTLALWLSFAAWFAVHIWG